MNPEQLFDCSVNSIIPDPCDPAILVGPLDEDDRAFYINPFGLQTGEEKVVGDRIDSRFDRIAELYISGKMS